MRFRYSAHRLFRLSSTPRSCPVRARPPYESRNAQAAAMSSGWPARSTSSSPVRTACHTEFPDGPASDPETPVGFNDPTRGLLSAHVAQTGTVRRGRAGRAGTDVCHARARPHLWIEGASGGRWRVTGWVRPAAAGERTCRVRRPAPLPQPPATASRHPARNRILFRWPRESDRRASPWPGARRRFLPNCPDMCHQQ